ncbi:MAG TPA: enoyl-CoA hydratase/isomerase family protein [Gammaproteobacteria bacterium]
MNEQALVLIETDRRGVATVTLNRSDKHNAFNAEMIAELTAALQKAGRDPGVRIVVLTGAGKSFTAGADLNWMKSMAGYSEDENLDDSLKLAELMQVLDNLEKPTIARVNGHAFGGGVGLVACCDIAIAVEASRFALSEVKLGLVPAVISPYVIAAIGERHARRFFLTAEAMDTATATNIGLVHEVVAPEALDAAVEREIQLLLAGGPAAQAAAKHLVRQVCHADTDTEKHLRQTTAEIIAQIRVSDEGQEGLAAFLEKRKPRWIKG